MPEERNSGAGSNEVGSERLQRTGNLLIAQATVKSGFCAAAHLQDSRHVVSGIFSAPS